MAHDPFVPSFIETDSTVFFGGRWHALPAGGDGPTDDANPAQSAETPAPAAEEEAAPVALGADLPEDLNGVEEETLRGLYEELRTNSGELADNIRTQADLDEVNRMRALAQRIAAEITRRGEEAQRIAAGADELRSAPLEELPAPAAAPAAADDERQLVGANQASAGALAAARVGQTDAEQNPPTQITRPRVTLLAAAGAENIEAGSPIDWAELGEAFDRIKTQPGGDAILASLPSFQASAGEPGFPELLTMDNGAARNGELMREAVADYRDRVLGNAPRQGAICDPLDIIREIPDAFSTAEPVRGVFPGRPAGRLGWQFMQSIDLGDVAAGIALWSEAQQSAVDIDDASTLKPCVEVDCPPIEEIKAQPVTACLTFDLETEMSNPERIGNFTNALAAMMARVKEGRILQRIDALSHSWQFFGDYGALPAVIEGLNTVLAQLYFYNRLEENQFVLLIPPGATEALTIDRANRAYGVEAETSDVLAYLRGNLYGVRDVVETLDSSLGGEPGLPFNALTPVTDPATPVTVPYISGSTFRFRLVAPEAAIYAETGQVNVGLTRDSRLIRANKTQYFAEEWFMLAKHGPQQWGTVDIRLCADGSRAGFVEPVGCVAS